MKKTLTFATFLAVALTTGCASTGDTKSTGNAAFDEAAKIAIDKDAKLRKAGYAWTSAKAKDKYGDAKTPDGKAFKEAGHHLTLVEVAVYEGKLALEKGDEAAAMKKVKEANALADAQMAQQERGANPTIMWK